MSIISIGNLIDAEISGCVRQYFFRKVPAQPNVATQWFDLSQSGGMPSPKYWFDAAPRVAKAISQSEDGGIYHGANVSPQTKYLRGITSMNNFATYIYMYLCDYLLYYPTFDTGVAELQACNNTVTLPRYADGVGVQMIAVCIAPCSVGNQQFQINYKNSDGADRTTIATAININSVVGSIINSWNINTSGSPYSANPFIPLNAGDIGVRSITSVQMIGSDTGLFSLILVKPLAVTNTMTAQVSEKDYLTHYCSMPIIKDDAYLNFLCLPNAALNTNVLLGTLKCIWG